MPLWFSLLLFQNLTSSPFSPFSCLHSFLPFFFFPHCDYPCLTFTCICPLPHSSQDRWKTGPYPSNITLWFMWGFFFCIWNVFPPFCGNRILSPGLSSSCSTIHHPTFPHSACRFWPSPSITAEGSASFIPSAAFFACISSFKSSLVLFLAADPLDIPSREGV